ncbi:MAG: hypothetical protein IRZ16_05305 [Myxococcaceae bacterium]|nr:hypothetical protein [Myxococcaceae bacterium]
MSDTTFDLRRLRIASPCSEKWSEMSGDDRVRHCAKCRLNVFNFEGLSVAEVKALLTERQGRVCVRMLRRRDGTVITRDCPVGARKVRLRMLAGLALAAGLVLAMVASVRRAPRSSSSPTFWPMAKQAAVQFEERARRVPVLGAVIEWIDPSPPVAVMGDVVALPPGSSR